LDDEVPVEWLADFLKLIHETPHLLWLLLTKRPENWNCRANAAIDKLPSDAAWWLQSWDEGKPPANVWVGTSVEDQQRADERIPGLLEIPAKVRFLSCEPLLGPVDLNRWIWGDRCPDPQCGDSSWDHLCELGYQMIHWAIIGGESGAGARPCNVEWIRAIIGQCRSAGVPHFVKQLGAHVVNTFTDTGEDTDRIKLSHPKGGDPEEWPVDLRVREFPSPVSHLPSGTP
jgi:protein gp37